MLVIIYSTTTCPYCNELKNYLTEKGISYTEKLVDQDDIAREEMLQESAGFMGVPFALFIKDDGTKETVLGFDKRSVDEILGIS